MFFDRTYFLGAQDEGADAYRLLHDALKQTGRAAAGRFVFHNREYLAAIRSLDGVLALHTMRYADEVVSGGDVDIPDLSRGPTQREVDMAAQLIEGLHEDFDAEQYDDEYREAILSLIEAKSTGKEIDVQPEDEQEADTDLAAALQASPARPGRSTSRRSSTSRTSTRCTSTTPISWCPVARARARGVPTRSWWTCWPARSARPSAASS